MKMTYLDFLKYCFFRGISSKKLWVLIQSDHQSLGEKFIQFIMIVNLDLLPLSYFVLFVLF